MLHELLVTMMGHPGDIFQEQLDFKITPGFTLLHIAEKTTLEQLAQLGYLYKRIQGILEEPSDSLYRSVFISSIDDYLNHYRADICDLEVYCMEPHSTMSTVQIKLGKVSIAYKVSATLSGYADFSRKGAGGQGIAWDSLVELFVRYSAKEWIYNTP
jgi:hypothetical protein